MDTTRAKSGQPLRIPASTYNAMLDAAISNRKSGSVDSIVNHKGKQQRRPFSIAIKKLNEVDFDCTVAAGNVWRFDGTATSAIRMDKQSYSGLDRNTDYHVYLEYSVSIDDYKGQKFYNTSGFELNIEASLPTPTDPFEGTQYEEIGLISWIDGLPYITQYVLSDIILAYTSATWGECPRFLTNATVTETSDWDLSASFTQINDTHPSWDPNGPPCQYILSINLDYPEDGLPDGVDDGDMLVWDDGAWTILPVGNTGQVLAIQADGKPGWESTGDC